ncbi:MAG: choice-of-anchor tandem repeat GloVer-containing protein [Rhodospirillales bacterium]
MTPPAPGQTAWTETTLRTFIADANGAFPAGSLVLDEKGNLYGTTLGGNNNRGVAFELSPPTQPDGDWTETVLHGFSGPDDLPRAGRCCDRRMEPCSVQPSEGGPSFNNGLVFELLPPTAHSAGWREKTLFAFSDGVGSAPEAGVISDSQGNLYGTTAGGGQFGSGVVFELSPPAKGGTVGPRRCCTRSPAAATEARLLRA